jgi:hypothetical protein
MDQKKLEKLENIKNYLENDDITGLGKYIERIRPTVKDDEDFLDIFEEFKNKNYDQTLFLTEEIIFDANDAEYVDEFDKVELDEFSEKDDIIPENLDDNFDDFTGDFNEDLAEDQFDDLPFYEDKDDDYY